MANNRLTWQNVAAPDFRGVSDSYRTMSALLERATQSGQGMLDTIRNTNTEAADRAIMQRMMGARDPNNFDPNAILGADAKNASLATIAGVGRHEDTLINRAGTKLNQEVTRGNYDWVSEGRGQIKQFSPQMQAALAAAGQGDRSGLGNPAFAGMRADLYSDFLRDGATAATNDMSLKTSGQRLTESEHNFGRQKRTEGHTDELNRAQAYLARAGADPEHAEQLLWQQNYSPEVINELLSTGLGRAGVSAGTGGGGGNLAGGVSDPSRVMNYMAREQGVNSLPDSVQTMGDFADWSQNQNRTGMKHTAAGTYQIVGSNIRGWGKNQGYAEKVFGENWRDIPWNAQAEDKVAEAIFKDNNGSAAALSKQWVSLSPAEAERVRKMPWSQARLVIAEKESGVAPAELERILGNGIGSVERGNAVADIVRADTMANSGSLSRELGNMEGQADTDISLLAQDLIENKGFHGYTQGEIANEIRRITDSAKVSKNQAAKILAETITTRSGFMGTVAGAQRFGNSIPLVNWFVPDAQIAENTFDRERADEYARAYREDGLEARDRNATRADQVQQLAQAAQQVESITAMIQQATTRYNQTKSPEILGRIEQLQEQLRIAQGMERMLIQGAENDPDLTSRDTAAPATRTEELIARAAATAQGQQPTSGPPLSIEDLLMRSGISPMRGGYR